MKVFNKQGSKTKRLMMTLQASHQVMKMVRLLGLHLQASWLTSLLPSGNFMPDCNCIMLQSKILSVNYAFENIDNYG
jgi:hypothetical protein